MKRTSFGDSICPVARSLDLIGDWWTLLIVRDAARGIKRFSEFQRSLGAAKNILSVRLKALVAEDILQVAPASDGSAYQEYVLTQKGRDLQTVLVALNQWGERYLFAEGEFCSQLVDKQDKKPLQRLQIHAEDGRVLSAQDIVLNSDNDAVA
ncbi:winged helix-turn-helix transcriptional regulator [Rouxiella sp. Mn2063]|uniref:winged helix-turn-helix transcriptional regulator n=1 Tax=Rouxiella sp. Mn2063 TaxID=3395262 RepID=UPI003BE56865